MTSTDEKAAQTIVLIEQFIDASIQAFTSIARTHPLPPNMEHGTLVAILVGVMSAVVEGYASLVPATGVFNTAALELARETAGTMLSKNLPVPGPRETP